MSSTPPLSSFQSKDDIKELFLLDLSVVQQKLNLNNSQNTKLAKQFLLPIYNIVKTVSPIYGANTNNNDIKNFIQDFADALNDLTNIPFKNDDKSQIDTTTTRIVSLLDNLLSTSTLTLNDVNKQEITNIKDTLQQLIDNISEDPVIEYTTLSMQSLAEALKIVNGLTETTRSSQFNRSLINIFETLNGERKNTKLFDDLYNDIYALNNKFDVAQKTITSIDLTKANKDQFDIIEQELTNAFQQFDIVKAQLGNIKNEDLENIIINNITNLYDGLIKKGQSLNNVLSAIIKAIQASDMADADKQQLIQVFERLKDSTNAQQINKSLNSALSHRIDKIIKMHDQNYMDELTKMSRISGIANKYDSAFRSAGQSSSELVQNISTYNITKEKDYNPLHNIRDITVSSVMNDMKTHATKIAALQYEYDNQNNTLMQLETDMVKAFSEGNIQRGQQLKEAYMQQHEVIITLTERLVEAATSLKNDYYGKLNNRQREQLGLNIKNNVDNILQQTQSQAKSVIVINEGLNLKNDISKLTKVKKLTEGIKEFGDKAEQVGKKSKEHTANLHTQFFNLINSITRTTSSFGHMLSTFGLKTISLGPISVAATTYEYDLAQGRKRYDSMRADALLGINDLNESAIRSQQQMLYGNELFMMSGGRINQYAIRDNYENMVRNIGGQVGKTPDQTAQDLNFFANNTVLLQSVFGIDQSITTEFIKTFYRDMRMSADQAGNAFAKLIQQAQSANVPIDQYISAFNELAKQYMTIGIVGEKAGVVLNNLTRHHIRIDIAKEVASQLASGLSTFGQNKNFVAFSGAMLGMDPFAAIANMAYTHEANGDPREQWINDAVTLADKYVNTIMPAYGNDPDLRMMGLVDIFKQQFGFSQRTASMLAKDYLENGNTQQFRDKFKEEQKKAENPNATLEDLNEKALGYLQKMTRQLAEGDRLEALLKGELFKTARHMGSMIDSILKEIAPLLRSIQGLTLEFTAKIVEWLGELFTSDLFKEAKDKIIDALSYLPVILLGFFGTLIVSKIVKFGWNLLKTLLGPLFNLVKKAVKSPSLLRSLPKPLAFAATVGSALYLLSGTAEAEEKDEKEKDEHSVPTRKGLLDNIFSFNINDMQKHFNLFDVTPTSRQTNNPRFDQDIDNAITNLDKVNFLNANETNNFNLSTFKGARESIDQFRYQYLYPHDTDNQTIRNVRALSEGNLDDIKPINDNRDNENREESDLQKLIDIYTNTIKQLVSYKSEEKPQNIVPIENRKPVQPVIEEKNVLPEKKETVSKTIPTMPKESITIEDESIQENKNIPFEDTIVQGTRTIIPTTQVNLNENIVPTQENIQQEKLQQAFYKLKTGISRLNHPQQYRVIFPQNKEFVTEILDNQEVVKQLKQIIRSDQIQSFQENDAANDQPDQMQQIILATDNMQYIQNKYLPLNIIPVTIRNTEFIKSLLPQLSNIDHSYIYPLNIDALQLEPPKENLINKYDFNFSILDQYEQFISENRNTLPIAINKIPTTQLYYNNRITYPYNILYQNIDHIPLQEKENEFLQYNRQTENIYNQFNILANDTVNHRSNLDYIRLLNSTNILLAPRQIFNNNINSLFNYPQILFSPGENNTIIDNINNPIANNIPINSIRYNSDPILQYIQQQLYTQYIIQQLQYINHNNYFTTNNLSNYIPASVNSNIQNDQLINRSLRNNNFTFNEFNINYILPHEPQLEIITEYIKDTLLSKSFIKEESPQRISQKDINNLYNQLFTFDITNNQQYNFDYDIINQNNKNNYNKQYNRMLYIDQNNRDNINKYIIDNSNVINHYLQQQFEKSNLLTNQYTTDQLTNIQYNIFDQLINNNQNTNTQNELLYNFNTINNYKGFDINTNRYYNNILNILNQNLSNNYITNEQLQNNIFQKLFNDISNTNIQTKLDNINIVNNNVTNSSYLQRLIIPQKRYNPDRFNILIQDNNQSNISNQYNTQFITSHHNNNQNYNIFNQRYDSNKSNIYNQIFNSQINNKLIPYNDIRNIYNTDVYNQFFNSQVDNKLIPYDDIKNIYNTNIYNHFFTPHNTTQIDTNNQDTTIFNDNIVNQYINKQFIKLSQSNNDQVTYNISDINNTTNINNNQYLFDYISNSFNKRNILSQHHYPIITNYNQQVIENKNNQYSFDHTNILQSPQKLEAIKTDLYQISNNIRIPDIQLINDNQLIDSNFSSQVDDLPKIVQSTSTIQNIPITEEQDNIYSFSVPSILPHNQQNTYLSTNNIFNTNITNITTDTDIINDTINTDNINIDNIDTQINSKNATIVLGINERIDTPSTLNTDNNIRQQDTVYNAIYENELPAVQDTHDELEQLINTPIETISQINTNVITQIAQDNGYVPYQLHHLAQLPESTQQMQIHTNVNKLTSERDLIIKRQKIEERKIQNLQKELANYKSLLQQAQKKHAGTNEIERINQQIINCKNKIASINKNIQTTNVELAKVNKNIKAQLNNYKKEVEKTIKNRLNTAHKNAEETLKQTQETNKDKNNQVRNTYNQASDKRESTTIQTDEKTDDLAIETNQMLADQANVELKALHDDSQKILNDMNQQEKDADKDKKTNNDKSAIDQASTIANGESITINENDSDEVKELKKRLLAEQEKNKQLSSQVTDLENQNKGLQTIADNAKNPARTTPQYNREDFITPEQIEAKKIAEAQAKRRKQDEEEKKRYENAKKYASGKGDTTDRTHAATTKSTQVNTGYGSVAYSANPQKPETEEERLAREKREAEERAKRMAGRKGPYGSYDYKSAASPTTPNPVYNYQHAPTKDYLQKLREKRKKEEEENTSKIQGVKSKVPLSDNRPGQNIPKNNAYNIAGTKPEEVKEILQGTSFDRHRWEQWHSTSAQIEEAKRIGKEKAEQLKKQKKQIEEAKKDPSKVFKNIPTWGGVYGTSPIPVFATQQEFVRQKDKEVQRPTIVLGAIDWGQQEQYASPIYKKLKDHDIELKRIARIEKRKKEYEERNKPPSEDPTKKEYKKDADGSRKKHSEKSAYDINKEQLALQDTNKTTLDVLDEFMQIDEDTFKDLQITITNGHKQLINMIKVTHQILIDINSIAEKSGALISAGIITSAMANGSRISGPQIGTGWGAYDIRKDSGVTAEQINKLFDYEGSVLRGTGEYFIKYARENKIDPAALAAIAAHESDHGRSRVATELFNFGGIFNTNNQYKSWENPELGIKGMAEYLAQYPYPKNGEAPVYTLQAIHEIYSPEGATNDPTNLNQYWVNGAGKNLAEMGIAQPNSNNITTNMPINTDIQNIATGTSTNIIDWSTITPQLYQKDLNLDNGMYNNLSGGFAENGCTITAASILLSTYSGQKVMPKDMQTENLNYMWDILNANNLPVDHYQPKTIEEFKQQLDAGLQHGPVGAMHWRGDAPTYNNYDSSGQAYNQHSIIYVAKNADDTYKVWDPYDNKYYNLSAEQIALNYKNGGTTPDLIIPKKQLSSPTAVAGTVTNITSTNTHMISQIPNYKQNWSGQTDALCGPTSTAILLESITGTKIGPNDILAKYGNFTDISGPTKALNDYNINYDFIQEMYGNAQAQTAVLQSLQAGIPVLLGVDQGPTPWNSENSSGHYVVLAGIKNGKLLVSDPGRNSERYLEEGYITDLTRYKGSLWIPKTYQGQQLVGKNNTIQTGNINMQNIDPKNVFALANMLHNQYFTNNNNTIKQINSIYYDTMLNQRTAEYQNSVIATGQVYADARKHLDERTETINQEHKDEIKQKEDKEKAELEAKQKELEQQQIQVFHKQGLSRAGIKYEDKDIEEIQKQHPDWTKEQIYTELDKRSEYGLNDEQYLKLLGMVVTNKDLQRRIANNLRHGIGPNDKPFSQNDIQYLLDNGYTKDQAYAALAADEKYRFDPGKLQAFIDNTAIKTGAHTFNTVHVLDLYGAHHFHVGLNDANNVTISSTTTDNIHGKDKDDALSDISLAPSKDKATKLYIYPDDENPSITYIDFEPEEPINKFLPTAVLGAVYEKVSQGNTNRQIKTIPQNSGEKLARKMKKYINNINNANTQVTQVDQLGNDIPILANGSLDNNTLARRELAEQQKNAKAQAIDINNLLRIERQDIIRNQANQEQIVAKPQDGEVTTNIVFDANGGKAIWEQLVPHIKKNIKPMQEAVEGAAELRRDELNDSNTNSNNWDQYKNIFNSSIPIFYPDSFGNNAFPFSRKRSF